MGESKKIRGGRKKQVMDNAFLDEEGSNEVFQWWFS